MEVEIKLGPAEPETALRAYRDSILLLPAGEEKELRMETTYYDSPEGALAARRQMVRLRLENGAGVCAFKGPAEGLARLELEAPADDIAQGAAALAENPDLPPEAAEILRGPLIPVCGAEYLRRTRLCRAGRSLVSLCLDRGRLKKGKARQPFCEVELELVQGDPADVERAAAALSAAYGLPVCPLSKQQRALALPGGEG